VVGTVLAMVGDALVAGAGEAEAAGVADRRAVAVVFVGRGDVADAGVEADVL
jgi:hypothetical protein